MSGFRAHAYFLEFEIDRNLSKTTVNDNSIITNNFGFLFSISIIESRISISDNPGNRIINSPGDIIKRGDFLTKFSKGSIELIIFTKRYIGLELEMSNVTILIKLL